jgi:endonuclease/exonuclease/phosphatase family metal-dependent hydrolase
MGSTKETLKWLWRITKENFGNKADGSIHIEFDNTNKLKIMTFNIRRDNLKDGDNNWQYRKDAIVAMIVDQKPDIICMQEVMPHMAKFLKDKLSKYYDCCGVECFTGREITKSMCVLGEGLLTMYRKDRFRLCSKEIIKLFDGRKINLRRAFVTYLKDNFTERNMDVINTHFCHKSEDARTKSFNKLRDWYTENGYIYETFFCGDFNCHLHQTTPFFATLLYSNAISNEGTINHFSGAYKKTIDFIFSNSPINESEVIRKEYDGVQFLSDHWPVMNTYAL